MNSSRLARQVVWIGADDCDPPHGLDMATEHDAGKVEWLTVTFKENGFDPKMPALVGYPNGNRIQLLSGTHRHLAAKIAGIKLPVTLWLRSDVEERWGTELWPDVIKDIPVSELEEYEVKDGFHFSPYERVNLSSIKD